MNFAVSAAALGFAFAVIYMVLHLAAMLPTLSLSP